MDILNVTMPVKQEMLDEIAMPVIKQEITEEPGDIVSDENLQKFLAICDYARFIPDLMESGSVASIKTEPNHGHSDNCNETKVNDLPIETKINEQLIATSKPIVVSPNNPRRSIDQTFKCDECGKSMSSKWILRRHKIIHMNVKPFSCDACAHRFSRKEYLKWHQLRHCKLAKLHNPGELYDNYSVCKKIFHSADAVRAHGQMCETENVENETIMTVLVKSAVDQMNPTILSDANSGKLSLESNVNQDEFNRSKDNLITCKLCEKHFKKIRYLERHIVLHNPVSPFKCDFCEQRFKRRDYLNYHKSKYHSNENPNSSNNKVTHEKVSHTCIICDKNYSQRKNLNRHLAVHHPNVSTHDCLVCKRKFETLHDLLQHKRVNRKCFKKNKRSQAVKNGSMQAFGLKLCDLNTMRHPFQCNKCLKKFRSKLEVNMHKRTHKQLLKCEQCQFSCSLNIRLAQHMRNKHSIHAKIVVKEEK